MEKQTTGVRRPKALRVIVGLYSTLVLVSFATTIYRLQARQADWTLPDHAYLHAPGILILLGCLGFVLLRRWAVYAFGLLLALRLREFAAAFFMDEISDVFLVWVPRAMHLSLAALAFFYGLHLWRKGPLREGVY